MHVTNHPKGNFSRGKLFGGNYLTGNRPRDNYPGEIIQGGFSGGNIPRGQLSSRAIFRGTISRGQLSGVKLFREQFSSEAIVRTSFLTTTTSISMLDWAYITLIWMGFLGYRFEVGRDNFPLPHPCPLLV